MSDSDAVHESSEAIMKRIGWLYTIIKVFPTMNLQTGKDIYDKHEPLDRTPVEVQVLSNTGYEINIITPDHRASPRFSYKVQSIDLLEVVKYILKYTTDLDQETIDSIKHR